MPIAKQTSGLKPETTVYRVFISLLYFEGGGGARVFRVSIPLLTFFERKTKVGNVVVEHKRLSPKPKPLMQPLHIPA